MTGPEHWIERPSEVPCPIWDRRGWVATPAPGMEQPVPHTALRTSLAPGLTGRGGEDVTMATRTGNVEHQADRMPTDEEAEAAEASTRELQESGEEERVAEHYREMGRIGSEEKGEGRIE